MEDLASVIDWAASRGWERPHVLAFSWGGRVAGRYAEDNAGKIDRLILYDPARGGGNLVLPAPKPDEAWWANTYANYAAKFEPELTDPDFLIAVGAHLAAREPRSPNGIRLENAHPVQAVDPTRVTRPTLMIYGIESRQGQLHAGRHRACGVLREAGDRRQGVCAPARRRRFPLIGRRAGHASTRPWTIS